VDFRINVVMKIVSLSLETEEAGLNLQRSLIPAAQ
jgi:hypothetical protein